MPDTSQQIVIPAVPELPAAGPAYSSRIVDQTNSNLRATFVRWLGVFRALFGIRGGQYLNTPYGAFQDNTDQTAANTTTAYAITFDTTDFSNGITLSNSSRLNVTQSGLYNYQFSIQFKNTTNDTQDVEVWFAKNGTNIAKSNSRFGLPARKSSGDPSHIVAALNFYTNLTANDYVQLFWKVSDVGVSIEAYPTATSPTRPAIPSVIATMSFVSNISA